MSGHIRWSDYTRIHRPFHAENWAVIRGVVRRARKVPPDSELPRRGPPTQTAAGHMCRDATNRPSFSGSCHSGFTSQALSQSTMPLARRYVTRTPVPVPLIVPVECNKTQTAHPASRRFAHQRALRIGILHRTMKSSRDPSSTVRQSRPFEPLPISSSMTRLWPSTWQRRQGSQTHIPVNY